MVRSAGSGRDRAQESKQSKARGSSRLNSKVDEEVSLNEFAKIISEIDCIVRTMVQNYLIRRSTRVIEYNRNSSTYRYVNFSIYTIYLDLYLKKIFII